MPSVPSPTDLLDRVRRDVERNVARARNGIKHVAGIDHAEVGTTPKQTVWRRDRAQLWRYHNDDIRFRPPLVIVMSLISRSYILDLRPGASVVQTLRDAGFDVYLLDWGIPDERDSPNTLATYVDHYAPEALSAAMEESGAGELTLMGYSLGGILGALITAGHPELPIRSYACIAAPIDFDRMGLQTSVIERLDPEALTDETGNIPANVVRESFRLLRPTGDLQQYANLWQNLWNDQFLEAYQAFGKWTRDHIPFPGGVAVEMKHQYVDQNALMSGSVRLGNRRVDLADLTCPTLNVVAEKDHIVPVEGAAPLLDLVGAEDTTEIRIPAGHVGLVAGSSAGKVTWPQIIEWLQTHSDPVG